MLHKTIWLTAAAIVLAGNWPALAGDGRALEPSPYALPAVSAPAPVSDAPSCAGVCQARHDKCRISTKGGPDCDNDRQRCVQACIVRKGR